MKQLDIRKTGEKKYSYSFALLKILMSFVVVMCHFDYEEAASSSGGGGGYSLWSLLRYLKPLAVPSFAFMAMFFTANSINNKAKIKNRVTRLIIPHVFWSAIYIFMMFLILHYKNEFFWFDYIKNSIFQIFCGSTYNGPSWFQVDLIIITIFIYILYNNISPHVVLRLIFLLSAGSLVLQYSGLNKVILDPLPYGMEGTLGRLLEIFPYACLGIWFKNNKEKILRMRWYFFALALVIITLFLQSYIPVGEGYNYSGVGYILSTTSIVYLCLIMSELRFNDRIEAIISYIASYTMGVYFIQYLIGYILAIVFKNFHNWNNIYRCFIVYVISFGICVLISKIPIKICKKFVM